MIQNDEYPSVGDVVVVTVKAVKKFGVFCDLETYPGKEGFIHIAEIATGWVKYIRDYIREGQRVVCKVIRVRPQKGHIDLSLKQVNEHQKREAIQQWKNTKKAQKLFELLAENLGKTVEECYEEFGNKLKETYGSIYNAMERVAIDPAELKDEGFVGDWIPAFIEIAQANIEAPFINIRGTAKLTCPLPDGINHIKKALHNGLKVEDEFDEEDKLRIYITYVGAPKYLIKVQALDYKSAEEALKRVKEEIENTISAVNGTFEFERESR